MYPLSADPRHPPAMVRVSPEGWGQQKGKIMSEELTKREMRDVRWAIDMELHRCVRAIKQLHTDTGTDEAREALEYFTERADRFAMLAAKLEELQ